MSSLDATFAAAAASRGKGGLSDPIRKQLEESFLKKANKKEEPKKERKQFPKRATLPSDNEVLPDGFSSNESWLQAMGIKFKSMSLDSFVNRGTELEGDNRENVFFMRAILYEKAHEFADTLGGTD